jgi:hypothetical protein
MACVDPCVGARHGICAGTRRMDSMYQEGKFLDDCPSVCGYVDDEDVSSFRGVYVTSPPNKDEFEPTSGPSVSGIACVGSCPTMLVESESHQHINPSAKCI